ncbi:hypothetical protein CANARDRAFT_204323 [[Candida] arabinofermentans NRRL YB-2248]|uniref:Exoribonuclease phosphorolytic domain-containing protein n=1 Tax=[Candida] arabinofermentans NRRL YB-2248 TaxID=983967 RepID=A0A1E4STM0_9ASCO|nr:hypothetical protein CANARDRAFT_204323 [[Candida] arabinofermentans NRRL YB-2248]
MNIIDRRRNLGPDNTIPLKFTTSLLDDEEPTTETTITTDSKIFIELGTIKNCNGSTTFENDKTIIITSLYGPRPNFNKTFNNTATLKINLEISQFINIDNLKLSGNNNTITNKEKLITFIESFILTNFQNLIILKNYPKSVIELYVQIISLNEKHTLLYIIQQILNSVSITLLDSKINIKAIATAGYYKSDLNELLINMSSNDDILSILNNLDDFNEGYKRDLEMCVENSRGFRVELNDYLLNDLTN